MSNKAWKKKHEAAEAVSGMPWTPKPTTKLDQAFGPSNLTDYLPAWADIPEDFRRLRSPWAQLVSDWFFSGLASHDSKPKAGIDPKAALAHCSLIMRSFEPSHEHKEAGVAYLLSLWFEEPKWTPAKREARR